MARLVVGCGYLGLRVAEKWLEQGHRVVAVTRGGERVGQLAKRGIEPLVGDVTEPGFLGQLTGVEVVLWAVGWDRSSSKSIRDVYVGGVRELVNSLPVDIQRLVYISSTGVYGQDDGNSVDEQSECLPERTGGRACLAAEQILLQSNLGRRTVILRLAGIYGTGRLPRAADLTAGRPLHVNPDALINLVHVDDAVRVVVRVADAELKLPTTYLVADGEPVARGEFYRHLAHRLRAVEPIFRESAESPGGRHESTAGKRVLNRKLCQELDFTFRYPSYQEGLAADAFEGTCRPQIEDR